MENLELAQKKLENELSVVTKNYQQMKQRISCDIKEVAGSTIAQTMESVNGIHLFDKMNEEEIRVILHRADNSKQRIFSDQSGMLAWRLAG